MVKLLKWILAPFKWIWRFFYYWLYEKPMADSLFQWEWDKMCFEMDVEDAQKRQKREDLIDRLLEIENKKVKENSMSRKIYIDQGLFKKFRDGEKLTGNVKVIDMAAIDDPHSTKKGIFITEKTAFLDQVKSAIEMVEVPAAEVFDKDKYQRVINGTVAPDWVCEKDANGELWLVHRIKILSISKE